MSLKSCQDYADKFLDITKKYTLKNSMYEYAWENGKAERINRSVRNNYVKHWKIKVTIQLIKSVD